MLEGHFVVVKCPGDMPTDQAPKVNSSHSSSSIQFCKNTRSRFVLILQFDWLVANVPASYFLQKCPGTFKELTFLPPAIKIIILGYWRIHSWLSFTVFALLKQNRLYIHATYPLAFDGFLEGFSPCDEASRVSVTICSSMSCCCCVVFRVFFMLDTCSSTK